MYEKYFGFSEKPFNTTPDPRFFFPSSKHTEALNSMYYAITERKGFVVITGEIGAGKTTITRALMHKFGVTTKIALITNTHLTTRELVEEILEDLEVPYRPGTKRKMLSQLNDYLIEQAREDINIVLIIDEAQNLSPKVLEEIRMLSNLETEKDKLIQIILVGQPQLKRKLEREDLEQFKQRIAVYYHLTSLDREETEEYIRHRLKVVSDGSVADLFSSRAYDSVFQYSCGIPRLINLICDSALLSGFVDETKRITDGIILEVVKERHFAEKERLEREALAESQPQPQYIRPVSRLQYEEMPPQPAAPSGLAELRDAVLGASQEQLSETPVRTQRKILCCSRCDNYTSCLTKWERGIRGEEQVCCPQCREYHHCIEKNKIRKESHNG